MMTNLKFLKALFIEKQKPKGEIYGFSYYTESQKDHIVKVFAKAATMKKGSIKYLNKKFNKK
jgi:hypothetical protein